MGKILKRHGGCMTDPVDGRGPQPVPPLFNFGAACWYFAQKLSDELEAAGKLVPIGVTDTAIGGNTTTCHRRF